MSASEGVGDPVVVKPIVRALFSTHDAEAGPLIAGRWFTVMVTATVASGAVPFAAVTDTG
jgi:hypothetical protein